MDARAWVEKPGVEGLKGETEQVVKPATGIGSRWGSNGKVRDVRAEVVAKFEEKDPL